MSKTKVSAIVKKPRRKKAANYALTKVANDLIDKKIAPKLENKQILYHLRITQFNNAISQIGDFNRVLPPLEQGLFRNDRIASQVRLKSIHVRGWITIPPYDISESNDRSSIVCRLMCLSSKASSSWTQVQAELPTLQGSLLRNGSGGSQYDGNIENHLFPTNTSVVTSHYDKNFYLKRGQIQNLAGGAAHMPALLKPFSFKVACKNKVLKFNNPLDTDPNNFAPFVCLGFAYTNGAAPSPNAVPWMTYTSTITYED